MADSLFSILSDKDFEQPREIVAVKAYVKRHFDIDVPVAMQQQNVVVKVPHAALAGSLRMHAYKIIEECDLSGRVIIRIGRG